MTVADRISEIQERRGRTDVPVFDRIEAEVELINETFSQGVTITFPPFRKAHWETTLAHGCKISEWVDDGE